MNEHVWIVAASGGSPRRLTSGNWSVGLDGTGPLSWSADGKTLAVVRYPTPYIGDSLASKVELVDVATGATRPLTSNTGLEGSPLFAPHGTSIVYQRNTGGDAANGTAAYLTTSSGGAGIDIHRSIDRNVDDYAWNPDGNGIYLLTPDGSETALWYRASGGTIDRVATGAVQAAGLGNVANDGATAFVGSTSSHPSELYLLASPSSKPVALTDLNAFVSKYGSRKSHDDPLDRPERLQRKRRAHASARETRLLPVVPAAARLADSRGAARFVGNRLVDARARSLRRTATWCFRLTIAAAPIPATRISERSHATLVTVPAKT